MNKTLTTVSELIDRRGEGNPNSPLFIFPSWGEKSIVKNQSLNSKVPSAMAVTAMYAGTSKEGHEDVAAQLLPYFEEECKPKITASNKYGNNALMLASEWGYENIVKLLLPYFEEEGKLNVKGQYGESALDKAKNFDNADIVELLTNATK